MRLTARLLFIALPLAVIGLANASSLLCATIIGQTAPALVVKELNGHTFDLANERGR
jgi:hypothetical protein